MAGRFVKAASSSSLPVTLFLFGIWSVAPGGDVARAQAAEADHRDFEIERTIRGAPLLRTSLDLSWQGLGGAINGFRVEGALDLRTIFRLGVDVTRLHECKSDCVTLVTLESVRGLVRVPLDRLHLAMGGGWTWRRTLNPASGPASYLAVGYRPMRLLSLDFASEDSFVNRRLDRTVDLGVSVGRDPIRVRAGYRWLSIGVEDLSGLTFGLGVQF